LLVNPFNYLIYILIPNVLPILFLLLHLFKKSKSSLSASFSTYIFSNFLRPS
jgi:hypothetical protein